MNLNQSAKYVEDIKDDLLGNWNQDLYDFVHGDPIRAFWTAYNLQEMIEHEDLDLEQYLLYSKQLRHCDDDLLQYSSQIQYWENKYRAEHKDCKSMEALEYVLSNMVYLKNIDEINTFLKFGKAMYDSTNKGKEK